MLSTRLAGSGLWGSRFQDIYLKSIKEILAGQKPANIFKQELVRPNPKRQTFHQKTSLTTQIEGREKL